MTIQVTYIPTEVDVCWVRNYIKKTTTIFFDDYHTGEDIYESDYDMPEDYDREMEYYED